MSDLYDPSRTETLIAEIEKAKLPDDLRVFLLAAAHRHTVFKFDQIANYYAHAPKKLQRLMEASALVILDVDSAIEHGFLKLHDEISRLFQRDYPDA